MVLDGLIFFGVGLAGGLGSMFLGRSERLLHCLIALATGIFLGTVFLHLLPEVAALSAAEHATDHSHSSLEISVHNPWLFVLLAILILFLSENLIFKQTGKASGNQHLALGYASFFGLSAHALSAGFGMAVASTLPSLEEPIFLSIASHKFAESFSLGTIFLLAGFGRKSILGLIVVFSAITPLGVFLGTVLMKNLDPAVSIALTAFAAGSFIFVALCDLLPEVFHHRHDAVTKVLLLLTGILIPSALHSFPA